MPYDQIIGNAAHWPGVLDSSLLSDQAVAAANRLADAAKARDWAAVWTALDAGPHPVVPYQWCPGGQSCFTPLHQVAWHDAETSVARELLRPGALTTPRDSDRRTAFDVAVERKQSLSLREQIRPRTPSLGADHIRALDRTLEMVIDGRISQALSDGADPTRQLRYPPVEVLFELPGQRVCRVKHSGVSTSSSRAPWHALRPRRVVDVQTPVLRDA